MSTDTQTAPKTAAKLDDDRRYVVAVDLGGTKILAAVYDEEYRNLGEKKKKTKGHKGKEEVFKRICKAIDKAMDNAGIERDELAGIGMGSPGPLDPFEGVILDTPNLGFRNFPLRARLEDEYEVPVRVDNDVNMGTYGEYHFGAGQGTQHMVGIFPGTGIGGGLILNGQLFRGATGGAGEIGHTIVQIGGPRCGCGQHGCIESLASRLAVASQAVAMAKRGSAPTILEEAGTDVAECRSSALKAAWKAGDDAVVEIISRSAEHLGVAMANMVNVLSPEMIVLGGGLVEALEDDYVDIAAESMRAHAMPWLVRDVQVKAAELGDYAALMGAARHIRENL